MINFMVGITFSSVVLQSSSQNELQLKKPFAEKDAIQPLDLRYVASS